MIRIMRLDVLALFILFLFSNTLVAESITTFGPMNFERANGKPIVSTHHFQASAGQGARLIIHNGGVSNNQFERVSSANIILNGEEIVSASDFNQKIDFVQKEIILKEQNQLSINIKSKPGSGFTLVVEADLIIPEDPAQIAPPLPANKMPSFLETVGFLFDSAQPVQTDIDPNSIVEERVAVIRGQIVNDNNEALPGVKISIKDHPEYGYTLSRLDGHYDFVVNGGGQLTLEYARNGYLNVQRFSNVPWNSFYSMPLVNMVALDPLVTAIQVANNAPQIARGNPVTDADGSRQASMIFPSSVTANMVMPDGSEQPLSTMSVRATEYTVGENGQERMPGELPNNSGYTYAVELSVDEAIAAGAKSVNFSKAIPVYVNNFLNFPVGSIVPAGYYDSEKSAWVPSENGKIVQVLSIDANGLAQLDIDGSGVAADTFALDVIGINSEELTVVASSFAVGESFWRVPVTHFTPWDFNWPYGPPEDAEAPPVMDTIEVASDNVIPDPDVKCGSIIECQNQVLSERIDIVGTPYSLNYSSNRTPLHPASRTVNLNLTEEEYPQSLESIEVVISIAGHLIYETFIPSPNLEYSFTWDGTDGYGRILRGAQTANIDVSYVYPAVYYEPMEGGQSFGRITDTGIPMGEAREKIRLRRSAQQLMGHWDATTQALGGWTIDVNHAYDKKSSVLFLGDGTSTKAKLRGDLLVNSYVETGILNYPMDIDVAPDGSVYVTDSDNHRILRFYNDGTFDIVAGVTGVSGYSGDGGLATEAHLFFPTHAQLGPNGNLFIADGDNHAIRKVDANGVITTIAGVGVPGYSGDEGLATEALLQYPGHVAISPDGEVYFSEFTQHRIRKIDVNGIISTFAGTGLPGYNGDGIPATQAEVNIPMVLEFDQNGNLYFTDSGNLRVRKINRAGIIEDVAGSGLWGHSGDGYDALNARFKWVHGLAIANDGTLYLTDMNASVVRKIGTDGIIQTISGIDGQYGIGGDVSWAKNNIFNAAVEIEVDDAGNLYITDSANHRIRKITPIDIELAETEILIPSKDGREAYVLNRDGKHLRTVDTYTNSSTYNFQYDNLGYLVSITDGYGNITRIERIGDIPTAVISPDGLRTELLIDSEGFLSSITNPAGDTFEMEYSINGLLTGFVNPNGDKSTMIYDALGRLRHDKNAAGGYWSLVRSNLGTTGFRTTVGTATGRATIYSIVNRYGQQTRTVKHPNGATTIKHVKPDSTKTFHEYALRESEQLKPGPRYGLKAPWTSNYTIEMDSHWKGWSSCFYNDSCTLTKKVDIQRSVVLEDPSDALSILSESTLISDNDKVTSIDYDATNNSMLITRPSARTQTLTFDPHGKILSNNIDGFSPINNIYDARGRLVEVQEGFANNVRSLLIEYDAFGFPSQITNALGQTTSLEHDLAGRLISKTFPDGRTLEYSYDPTGNLIGITPPGKDTHEYIYRQDNIPTNYIPPTISGLSTATVYEYNLDKDITRIIKPDGETIDFEYNLTQSWLREINAGNRSNIYLPNGTGQLKSITSSYLNAIENHSIEYTYFGVLPENVYITGGRLNGVEIEYKYNNDFLLTSYKTTAPLHGSGYINRTNHYSYNDEKEITQAGDIQFTRNPSTGLITATNLYHVNTNHEYDEFGNQVTMNANYQGIEMISQDYIYDKLNRVVQKMETIEGESNTYYYDYDVSGRLVNVTKNNQSVAQYIYDDNGNRIDGFDHFGPITSTVDAQDRLVSYNGVQITYTPNGELATKNVNGDVIEYTYDEFGNLSRVVSDSDWSSYIYDAYNRRIGCSSNQFNAYDGIVYTDQLRPIALTKTQYISTRKSVGIVANFVYGDKPNVPEYIVFSDAKYRLITDTLGSVRLVVNVLTGEIAQRMDYDAFGNVILDTNPGFQPFGYAGGLYDHVTKLTRFGARDYDAQLGRWLTKDPIQFNGGDSNLYGYVLGDPVNFIDADGLRRSNANGSRPFGNPNNNPILRNLEQSQRNIPFNPHRKYNRDGVNKILEGIPGQNPRRDRSGPNDWLELFKPKIEDAFDKPKSCN